jgi:hypothetical protein
MKRLVQPEILDSLSPDHPAAVATRRDIRLFNRLMGNFKWMARMLRSLPEKGPLLELGAGDGSLAFHLLRVGAVTRESAYTGLDLMDKPRDWPASWQWHRRDLREAPLHEGHAILIGNLILHQFEDPDLRALGEAIKDSNLQILLFSEPCRSWMYTLLSPFTRFLGAHPVSLHDAHVSIRAGFRRDELAHALGLSAKEWEIRWEESLIGANRLVCRRV